MDETLIEYIKETSGAGFADEQIKAQLVKSGWSEQEITEGFAAVKGRPMSSPLGAPPPITPAVSAILPPPNLPPQGGGNTEETDSWLSRHKGTLITILAVIILLPLVSYGGLWAYQKYFAKTGPTPEAPIEEQAADAASAKTHDGIRIKDVANLQAALATYYNIKKIYPAALPDLTVEKAILTIPTDPGTGKPYLYKALDDPALHYSLSFVLETRMGTLPPGLQVVTDEVRLPAEAIQNQENVVKGAATAIATEKLLITDLSASPFYPQEEVRLEITAPADAELVSTFLIMNDLELVDQNAPLGFTFTAPKTSGIYPVQIFAFDKKGQGYLQKTSLTVK